MWVVSANGLFATVAEETISGVHVSPRSAETLVRRGGITIHHSMTYSLSSIFDKNYQNRLMCFEVTVCNFSVVFRHDVLPAVFRFPAVMRGRLCETFVIVTSLSLIIRTFC